MVGHKVTTISEIMPMIGARFYLQIENLQLKNDFVEDELSKVYNFLYIAYIYNTTQSKGGTSILNVFF